MLHKKVVAGVAQSVAQFGAGWTVQGLDPGRRETSRDRPDRTWRPHSLQYNEYRVSFPGIKRPGHGVDHLHEGQLARVNWLQVEATLCIDFRKDYLLHTRWLHIQISKMKPAPNWVQHNQTGSKLSSAQSNLLQIKFSTIKPAPN